MDVDIVVHLRCEEISVPDYFLDEGNMRKQTAITVNWVTNGFDRCHVGFLPLPYVPDASVYEGALCQVISVFDVSQSSRANQAKWDNIMGLCARW